jgi:hypothetical protein
MLRKILSTGFVFVVIVSTAAAADTTPGRNKLSAGEIVDKNIAARGGLQAWRAVQTLSFTGKLGAGGDRRGTLSVSTSTKQSGKLPTPRRLAEEAELPFVMEMERPRKERLELQFNGQTAVQVYDGINGWKVRPFLNRHDIEPYSAAELKAASMQADIDGPLVDYATKGTHIELVGMEQVENRDTYKLKLTIKSGQSLHLWIDAQTFLETKIEGQPRELDGRIHPVEIYYRDYRSVNGLQIPYILETKVLPLEDSTRKVKDSAVPAERIVIEKAVLNPRLEESLFKKPQTEIAANIH